MSTMLLKKHQRALITNFQKNTVSDLGWGRWMDKNGVKKRLSSLSNSVVSIVKKNSKTDIQEDDELIYDEDPFELETREARKLNDVQLALIKELQKCFNSQENVADKCILYEITGYQQNDGDDKFWDQHYGEFEKLGDDKLVSAANDETNKKSVAVRRQLSKQFQVGALPGLRAQNRPAEEIEETEAMFQLPPQHFSDQTDQAPD